MKTCTIWYKDGSSECRELLETPVSERVTLATLAGFDCYDSIDHVDFPLTDGAVPAGDNGSQNGGSAVRVGQWFLSDSRVYADPYLAERVQGLRNRLFPFA